VWNEDIIPDLAQQRIFLVRHEDLTTEQKAAAQAFLEAVMRANKDRSVFVHCQVNLRGSSFVFLYRVIHEGADVRESLAKLTGVWSPDPVWKRFIEETLALHGKKVEIL